MFFLVKKSGGDYGKFIKALEVGRSYHRKELKVLVLYLNPYDHTGKHWFEPDQSKCVSNIHDDS